MWCDDLYLTGGHFAVVLDLFARKPVGWAMSPADAVSEHWKMAWETRGKPVGAMTYSDQGSHYTSRRSGITVRYGSGSSESAWKLLGQYRALLQESEERISWRRLWNSDSLRPTDYIGYYSAIKTAEYNGGLPPTNGKSILENSNSVASFADHSIYTARICN